MDEGSPPPSLRPKRRRTSLLLAAAVAELQAHQLALQAAKSQSDELRFKVAQYGTSGEALGYTDARARELREDIHAREQRVGSLTQLIPEIVLAHQFDVAAEAQEAAALRQACSERESPRELQPEPQPEPEPEPEPGGPVGPEQLLRLSSRRREITSLRQALVRREEFLKRCANTNARQSMTEYAPTVTKEIATVRKRLSDLGFHEPHAAPWCLVDGAERARRGLPLRILSIDGGGIKGLLPAIVLEEIEDLCAPHTIDQLFDLVVGTSTGGILALGVKTQAVYRCL